MNCIGNLKNILLYRFNDNDKRSHVIVLEPITEEQEKDIELYDYFSINREGNSIKIKTNNIYFYGEIDVNNEDDCDIIIKKHLVDTNLIHSWIPTNFNYNTGFANTKKWYPTTNALDWFKYCHCRIGKPKRIIAYKINSSQL